MVGFATANPTNGFSRMKYTPETGFLCQDLRTHFLRRGGFSR